MRLCLAPVIALTMTTAALAGPEWPETGDAGNLPATSQTPTGSGELKKISGQLEGFGPAGDYQDMYLIFIDKPQSFLASTSPLLGGSSSFDTMLWLFRADGTGLLGNNDGPDSSDSTLRGVATDGSGAAVTERGLYYIAISGFNSNPVSQGGSIFNLNPQRPGEVSGPDGEGGEFPITGWSGPGATGTYSIALEGVEFVPSPGALALFGIAGLARRRRR